MPYKLDGKCVKKESGETVKCHDTVEQAKSHLAALEANVEDAKSLIKQATVFSQAQVGYEPLSTHKGQACANCVFYRATAYDGIEYPHCLIVCNDDPNPIEPTGYCTHWEAKPEPPPEIAETITEAVTGAIENMSTVISGAMAEAMPMAETEYEIPTKESAFMRLKKTLFGNKPLPAFSVHKGKDGKWYWVANYTNAYEDKEDEIFTEKAHENFIARVDMGLVDKPELWTWHVKGSKHGKADVLFGVGRMVVAIGHFEDTPAAKNAIKFYQKNAGKIKLSHGAIAPTWAVHDGIIESYNTFEISTLPDGMEANPYTSFEAVKQMQPNEQKLAFVTAALGKEKTEEIVASLADKSKELDEMQIRYKDFAEVKPDVTKQKENTETQTNMSEVFVEMVKEQGQFVDLMKAMEKRQSGTDELIKSLTAQVKAATDEATALKALVVAGPQRPTTSPATLASETEVTKAQAGNDEEAAVAFAQKWNAPMKKGSQGVSSNGSH